MSIDVALLNSPPITSPVVLSAFIEKPVFSPNPWVWNASLSHLKIHRVLGNTSLFPKKQTQVGRTYAAAEAPIIWPPDAKNWLIGKDSDAGKDWRHEEKGTTDDEMVGWHHWLDGQEFEQAPAVGDGQGSVACCSSWGDKESDMTEWLNWIISHMTLDNLNYDSCDWGTEFLVVFNCNHFKFL